MSYDEATIAGIKWAAEQLKGAPDRTFSELVACKPDHVKLWKGVWGAVKQLVATGEMPKAPRAKRIKRNGVQPAAKAPATNGNAPVKGLLKRLDALEEEMRNVVDCLDQHRELLGA